MTRYYVISDGQYDCGHRHLTPEAALRYCTANMTPSAGCEALEEHDTDSQIVLTGMGVLIPPAQRHSHTMRIAE